MSESPLRAQIDRCKATWQATLRSMGVPVDVLFEHEEIMIARAIGREGWGADFVEMALFGSRFEPKTKDFNPADYICLRRVLGQDKSGGWRADYYVNLGRKERARAAVKDLRQAEAAKQAEDDTPCDPERVRQMIGSVIRSLK